ncbi:hypothetical protein RclHR1_04600003 [Rhizophagus clarus]|uniref:C2H2-type domain-containing protein n=1 Tax=Rhizophagus clarus TaxID=94130 RepID=A0A2Z6RN90_9GLOM|nr:hypothetical protein RclHR1_04600003 [Rhizophagus clarus]
MPESINLMPFVCKWYSHSEPQHFKTQEELRNHIYKHIKSCNRSVLGYICPWEGCNKRQSSIIKLEEHLCRHTRQRPFKCPICTGLRFCSLDELNRHLIFNHNDNIVEPDSGGDTCDENEELNLAQVKDKNDVHVKKEGHKDEAIAYTKGKDNNTAKLSYRDVLVKDRNKETEGFMKRHQQHERAVQVVKSNVYENKETEGFMKRHQQHEQAVQVVKSNVYENKEAEDFMERRRQNDRAVQELLYKARVAMSLLPKEYEEYEEYDLENHDNLPDMPQEELTEVQEDQLIWETFCESYKGTKAGEYFSEAFEIWKKDIDCPAYTN